MPRGTFQFGKARGSVSSFICNLQTAIFVVVIEQKNPKQTHVVPYHFLTEKGFQRFKCQFKNTHILQVKKSHTTHLWHRSWDASVSKSIALVQREIPLFDGLL